MSEFPNPLPRPEGELATLRKVWESPTGIGRLKDVNNTRIGIYYIGTAFLFFLFAGILALIIRIQLAVPSNDFVDQETYNQVFTMHGTIMMFLFAVPAVEAMGVYLLPNMLAARDLPFPRLSAYAFWAYAFGGIFFFCSLFFGLAPDGGWFMYPPLTSYKYSPGINADFWLLGIGFIEISAIAGAVEIIVGVLRTRAPGMGLDKLPVYAWSMLIVAAMIVFAFPAIILATLLLEIERSFHWPFFIPEQGGHPLLWQHLFWFFGHPEVYIIFLPAAGFVSMIVPTMAGVPLVGYRWVVLALIATGFLAFGVWVHHMFATGIPDLSVSFFSAASMGVAVPSSIQIFAWIATIARGKLRWNVPSLFVMGFVVIFTLGGLTGVMVGIVPFDWQVHDTHFVVAHFHYVLIGGMVFPFFAALYYWIPVASKRALSERTGRWVFWLMFIGFNVGFFPMHISGLLGMPRRIWTYAADMEWGWLNMLSTVGAFVLALGVFLFLFDLARNFRPFRGSAGNVWNAGTLEWLPNEDYATRSIPPVRSLDPIWDDPDLPRDVEAARYYLPGAPTGRRETIVTSPVTARPQYLVIMPGPSWPAFLAALLTALFFLLLTFKLVWWAAPCGTGAVILLLVWMWDSDYGPISPPVDIGGGIRLPVYVTGPDSHSWWAMVVLLLVSGSTFACLIFSYFFLWAVAPRMWPSQAGIPLPNIAWPLASAMLLALSSLAMHLGSRALARMQKQGPWPTRLALLVAPYLMIAACLAEIQGQWRTGLRPNETSYGAIVYMTSVLQASFVAILTVMALFVLARSLAGRLDPVRRASFDNTALLWHYTSAQGLVALALLHLAPRAL